MYIPLNSRQINERKNVDVLTSSHSLEAQGFIYEGGDEHTLHAFRDEDDGGHNKIPWSVIDEAIGASESREPRISERLVRELHDEEFDSEEEEENNEEREPIAFEDDEDY